MQLRCNAHILNLIVAEGLIEYHESIPKICNVVRFIKSSPSKTQKFKAYAKRKKISSNNLLCLDVETRWNSIYFHVRGCRKVSKSI